MVTHKVNEAYIGSERVALIEWLEHIRELSDKALVTVCPECGHDAVKQGPSTNVSNTGCFVCVIDVCEPDCDC